MIVCTKTFWYKPHWDSWNCVRWQAMQQLMISGYLCIYINKIHVDILPCLYNYLSLIHSLVYTALSSRLFNIFLVYKLNITENALCYLIVVQYLSPWTQPSAKIASSDATLFLQVALLYIFHSPIFSIDSLLNTRNTLSPFLFLYLFFPLLPTITIVLLHIAPSLPHYFPDGWHWRQIFILFDNLWLYFNRGPNLSKWWLLNNGE